MGRAYKKRTAEQLAAAVKRNFKYKYGITAELYEFALTFSTVCAVCKKPFDKNDGNLRPVFDHDHKTGQARQFIHCSCNKALGFFQDDPAIYRLAAEYLEKHASKG